MFFKISIMKLSYLLIVLGYVLTLTTIPHADFIGSIFTILAMIISLYKVFFLNRYNIKQLLILIIIGILFFISAYRTKNYQFLSTIIFVFSATSMSIDELIRSDIKLRIPLLFFICLLGYSGIILNRVDLDIRGIGLQRQALGFSHPNNFGAMLMVITIYYFYVKHKNFKLFDYLFLIFADYLCYSVAVSRTSAFVITAVIIVEFLDSLSSILISEKILQKSKRVLIALGSLLNIIIPCGSIYLGVKYTSNEFYLALDSIFSSRMYLLHTAIKNNGITLFGQHINVTAWTATNVIAEKTNAIDNLYGYILVNFGIVSFIIIILALIISYICAYINNENKICMCILFFVIAGFCENKMFYIGTNVFTLYISVALYQVGLSFRRRRTIALRNNNMKYLEEGNG